MRFLAYSITLIIFLSSCNTNSDFERYLSKTSISCPTDYRIIEFRSDWAIGESEEYYALQISDKDYKRITNEIKSKTFFTKLGTSNLPKFIIDSISNVKRINETAFWYDNKYFYQIFRPNPASIITIELENDSLMTISYEDL